MEQYRLLVKVLHHLTTTFKEHAVLKGGIELALFSSPRHTNDLDFVFVPYQSKKDIVDSIKECLSKLAEDVVVDATLTSKYAKFYVRQGLSQVEIEVSVASDIESIPMNTAAIAKPYNLLPQIVRVMKPEVALAHKIAAWNERRLLRDIYDIYFWFSVQSILPDSSTLLERLNKVESRIPSLSKRKSMTIQELCLELQSYCQTLDQGTIDLELASIPKNEREGLAGILQSQINVLISRLKQY